MSNQLQLVDPSDPILRETIAPYEGNPRALRSIAVGMWELMRRNQLSNYSLDRQRTLIETGAKIENGIGLAANQVGQRVRMLVMDLRSTGRFDGAKACINPEILTSSELRESVHEGCLTWPGKRTVVTRPKSIRVRYLTLKGKTVTEDLFGWPARAFQHELDHLDGRPIFG